VDNRPGGGTVVAMELVVKAPPDATQPLHPTPPPSEAPRPARRVASRRAFAGLDTRRRVLRNPDLPS
jgi:hypothetical protein